MTIIANIGKTTMSLSALLSANPIETPIAHAALHLTAVIPSPETELFLKPHKWWLLSGCDLSRFDSLPMRCYKTDSINEFFSTGEILDEKFG